MSDSCALCSREVESITHLFYQCHYSMRILDQVLLEIGGFFNTKANFIENAIEVEKLMAKSKVWGLHWTLMASVSWIVWKEHNQRYKRGKFTSREVHYR